MASVKVLAYNRPILLRNCLNAIVNSARLYKLTGKSQFMISLDIFVDGPATSAQVRATRQTCYLARKFQHQQRRLDAGLDRIKVTCRPSNYGILGQWVNAWRIDIDGRIPFATINQTNPISHVQIDEIAAIFIEDDVRITPICWHLLEPLVEQLSKNPSVYGIALQHPQWQLGVNEHGKWRRLNLLGREEYGTTTSNWENLPNLFFYPAVGTWGQVMFPKPWNQFIQWIRTQTESSDHAMVTGLVSKHWAAKKRLTELFSPWFMQFAYNYGLTNTYVWFGNQTALSTSEQSSGTNFNGQQRTYMEGLVTEDSAISMVQHIKLEQANGLKMPLFNYCFDRILDSAEAILVEPMSLEFDAPEYWMNWLCYHQRYRQLTMHPIVILSNSTFAYTNTMFKVTRLPRLGPTDIHYKSNTKCLNSEYLLEDSWKRLSKIEIHKLWSLTKEPNDIARSTFNQARLSLQCAKVSCIFTRGLYPH